MSNLAQLDVASRLVNLIGTTLKVPPERIGPNADLESLGINSLILMELIENIEQEFCVSLTPAQVAGVSTLSGLAEVLETLQGGESPATAPATPASTAAPAARPEPAGDVLSYIREKYAVDLSQRGLSSVDEMVEALMSDHSGALLQHYGIPSDRSELDRSEKTTPTRTADIAIVGMSCRLPDAPDALRFWRNLLDEKNSMREIPASRWNWAEHFAASPSPGKSISKWGALIEDVDCFDASFFGIPPEEARIIDPQQRLLLQETYRAIESAGMDIRKLAGTQTGVFVGYEYSEYEHYLRARNNQSVQDGPLFSSSSPAYYLAHRISFLFDLRGPSESINIQCASSAVAINRAYYSLINGESDLAIAGGVSLNLFPGDYIASSQYGLLSSNGTSGVFDNNASGFTRGEGVGAIVLKRLEDARRDNDRIYGVIKACHHTYRGAARSISDVRHEAFTSVLSDCYRKAGIDPETVRYIEVDGYATKWADSIEYEGIKNTFRKSGAGRKHCALGSVKGNIGNVEAASGVTSVIKVALALYHRKFPATISKKKLSSFIDVDNASHPLYIADTAISFEEIRQGNTPIRAGINSFADSGTNVHILLEEYMDTERAESGADSAKQLCVFSAKDAQRLEAYIQEYIELLSPADKAIRLTDLAYTLQTGREALNERLAIVAASPQELFEKLSLVRKCGLRAVASLASKDIYYGRIDSAEKQLLAGLITADMVRAQVQQGAQTRHWKQTALLWVNGVAIPWDAIWDGKSVRRALLPCYPFARDRHWVDVEPALEVHSAAEVHEGSCAVPAVEVAARWYFHTLSEDATAPADAVVLGRAEKIQLFLQQEAALQLRKPSEEIALDATLIDLGLSSVGIAALINRTDQLLHTRLSPGVVFSHPEIRTLAVYLAETYPEAIDKVVISRSEPPGTTTAEPAAVAATPMRVVPVQARGTRPAIFALPGAGANALSLTQLSRALGNDQPFYCLEPPGLHGEVAPIASVEALAELHIGGMKSVQGKGPYRLLGYSNGGVVAFEMARQLLEQHERVASLTLLDSLCPTLRNQSVEQMMVAVFKHFVRTLGGVSDLDIASLQQVPAEERSEYLYEHIVRLGVEVPRKQFLATFNVAAASERGCRAYLPAKLSQKIDVTLFRATEGYADMPEDYGWRASLAAPLRVCAIKADHFSVAEREAAREIAREINVLTGKAARRAASGMVREARYQAV